jgi:ATP-dependent Clp protease ATP-binding subunit ClpB
VNGRLDSAWPVWLRDVDSLVAVHPHFVLSGNVADHYLLPVATPIHRGVTSALHRALAPQGFDVIVTHDVVDGFDVVGPDGDSDAGWARVNSVVGEDLRSTRGDDLEAVARVIRALAAGGEQRLVLVLEHASRLVGGTTDLQPAQLDVLRVAAKMSRNSVRVTTAGATRPMYNPVFWLVEREHDLPVWYTAGNPAVREIAVPLPDLGRRFDYAELMLGLVDDAERRHELAERLAAGTDGLGLAAVADVYVLLHQHGLDDADPDDAVRTYKLGAVESPWRFGSVAERLRGDGDDPDATTRLSSVVLGQPRAVTKAVDILTRAVIGLSGAQASRSSSRPRGVLFFVGPTGTGKTELAKSITELVFGDADSYVRFDMSEFSAEHAGDRLIGAPPGYVGFDAGGELTNAVRQRPHSLLLFDEVEKAAPQILDKFLQVLEDGRLTDGRGTTVHFSETLIVFTSNIGLLVRDSDGRNLRHNITPSDDYETIERKVKEAVTAFFTTELNRPELLNRIGDNVVVFDFIRPDVATAIADMQIANVLSRVQEAAGVSVTLSDAAADELRAMATADLSFGARGIGNVIESRFVNPLARALFAAGVTAGDSLEVVSVAGGSSVPEVVVC